MEKELVEKSRDELLLVAAKLEATLKKSEQKNRQLENQLHEERAAQIEKQKLAEAEEEFITIKLLKRLEELKIEKTKLIAQVEREEEYLTNTLQKELERLEQEKVNLENKVEIEEEYIVNKLQKQLEQLLAEKNLLEQQLEGESVSTIEIRKLRLELDEFRRRKDKQIGLLKAEKLVLQQQLDKYKMQYEKISSEKLELERSIENAEEHTYNTELCLKTPNRGRSVSSKPPRSLTLKSSNPSGPPPILSPRKSRGGLRNNFLKKAWFDVRQDGEDEATGQYMVLSEDALMGFGNENVEHIPDDAILTTINLDRVEKCSVNAKDKVVTINLKNGETYHLMGPDADSWCRLIRDLLPC